MRLRAGSFRFASSHGMKAATVHDYAESQFSNQSRRDESCTCDMCMYTTRIKCVQPCTQHRLARVQPRLSLSYYCLEVPLACAGALKI